MYLDRLGLLAVWREGLLAKKVLLGKTKGYKNHPQLVRFRCTEDPVLYIDVFLENILKEALRRGYNFDSSKITHRKIKRKIPVTDGQIRYEFRHLKRKLKIRDHSKYLENLRVKRIKLNPVFRKIHGDIEAWEREKINLTT